MFFKLKTYAAQSKKLAVTRPDCFSITDLIRYFPSWWSYLKPGRNSMKDQSPWIAFAAIDFLEGVLTKGMLAYEFGSGGSTLFFASRVREVVSVEHNPEWFARVVEDLDNKGIKNCTVRLCEAESGTASSMKGIANPDAYVSDDADYRDMNFMAYASSIDTYPDRHFDIVFIDGRVRPSCFKHSLRKVKENGYLILDNAEREYYSYVHKTLDDGKWQKHDFYGPVPYILHFSETCIWKKIR